MILPQLRKNFTTPRYKFTLIDPGPANLANFIGGSSTFSLNSGAYTDGWQSTNTAKINVPSTFSSFYSGGAQRFVGTVQVRVDVIESTGTDSEDDAQPILASDTITITGIRTTENGIWSSLSNEAHTIVADQSGIPVGDGPSTNSARANTHVISNNSGTTIEVGKGRTILDYVPHEDVVGSQGSNEAWGYHAGNPRTAWSNDDYIGKWTINSVTAGPATGSVLVSVPTSAGSDGILTIPDHEFNKALFDDEGDTAVVQYSMLIEEDSSALIRQQSFSKSKQGFTGVTIVQTNQFESLPSDPNGRVKDFSLSANSINVFVSGLDIPWYPSDSAASSASVDTYWAFTGNPTLSSGTYGSGVTIINTGGASNGSTGYIGIAPIQTMPNNTTTATYSIKVVLDGSDETFTVTQTLTKTKNNTNISAFSSLNHYIFDADITTPSPNTNHVISVNTSSPQGVTEYITIAGPGFTNEEQFVSSGNSANNSISPPNYSTSGTLNYPRTYTLRLYDWDGTGTLANDGVLLDTDTVSVSASRSAADNIILDLTNDNETLGAVKGVNLGNGNSTIATTTANIYIGGTQSNSGWTFSASALSGVTTNRNASTGALPSNVLNITQVNSTFTNGTITITATHDDYDTQQAVFSLSRINGTNTFRIVPDPTVVTYDPNAASNNYNPTNATVTFTFKEIKSDGTSSNFTGGFFKVNTGGGFGNLQTIDSSASTTHSFSGDTSAASVTVQLFSDTSGNNLVDEETVPLLIGGEDGAPGTDGISVDLSAERAAVSYSKDANDTYDADDNSVQLTVTTSGITSPQYSWSGQAVTQNATPNATNTNTLSFPNNVSLTVAQQAKTANVEVTGQNSDGQAITAIQRSITIPTTVGAIGGDGLLGLRATSGFLYSTGPLTSAQATAAVQSFAYTGYDFQQQTLQGTDSNWSLSAPTFNAQQQALLYNTTI